MNNEHNHEHEQPAVDKYTQAINESNVTTDDLVVKNSVDRLLAEHLDENRSESIYRFMFNCIDLTTLNSTDSERSVASFTRRVNDFEENYPQYPNVAAICVYSNFAGVVRQNLEVSEVNIAVCSANFPSSQAHLEVKCAETALAVGDGADEVDIVLNLGYFADRAYEDLCDEISEIKEAAGSAFAVREAKNIQFRNVRIKSEKAMLKHVIDAEEVDGLKIADCELQTGVLSGDSLRCVNVRGLQIENTVFPERRNDREQIRNEKHNETRRIRI